MKYFILLMLVSSSSMADCTSETKAWETQEQYVISTDVPSHLKGATITVKRADGKETTVPAEQFKVVPRKQQFLVKAVLKIHGITCRENKSNRVSLLGGYGSRNGLSSSSDGTTTTVETSTGLVGGAQYQRMLDDRWSLGVQGQTNNTGSLLFGLDF
jgi:hypothetical protein